QAARALFEEGLALYRELGHKPGISYSLRGMGLLGHDQGDYGAARALHVESLAMCRDVGNKHGIAGNLEGLAAVAIAQAQPERAVRLFGAAEAVSEAIRAPLPPAER